MPQAQSEIVARKIFPETTIVRPAPLFGFEDRLLHKLAGVTNLFTTNHMKERFWPVHVSIHSSRVENRALIDLS
jgi:NADH dehydrogenase (ubiquinone) 1 alpha subcomplex subunit 9